MEIATSSSWCAQIGQVRRLTLCWRVAGYPDRQFRVPGATSLDGRTRVPVGSALLMSEAPEVQMST